MKDLIFQLKVLQKTIHHKTKSLLLSLQTSQMTGAIYNGLDKRVLHLGCKLSPEDIGNIS